jgi:hypothetical protein
LAHLQTREADGVAVLFGAPGGFTGESKDQLLSVYSELLRLALAGDDASDISLSDLVSRAVALRATATGSGNSASRIGDALAYDVALVHLCDRLGISHDLAGEFAGPEARGRAEQLVLERIPSLEAVLIGRAETGVDGGGRG